MTWRELNLPQAEAVLQFSGFLVFFARSFMAQEEKGDIDMNQLDSLSCSGSGCMGEAAEYLQRNDARSRHLPVNRV